MKEIFQLIKKAEDLESKLGTLINDQSLVSLERILKFDEQEALDEQALQFIKDWGYFDYFIPHKNGGNLHSLQSIYILTKIVARRDLTLSIALNLNFLSSLPIWISGNTIQKQNHTHFLKEGRVAAFALTEQSHGSDLFSNELHAKLMDDHWLLNGEKWCINYATLGDRVTLLCRTHFDDSPLSFTLFHLEKSTLFKAFVPSKKLHTHGVRGLDISGFSLKNAKLSLQSMIGTKGQGLATVYKALQVSRTLCSGLSVGVADTALRLGLKFSLTRNLYGKKIIEIPVVLQRLTESFCLQLIQDCTSLTVVRAATIKPEGLGLWSAIVKFLIPNMSEMILNHCRLVLGARGYLREASFALFQKILRDSAVVGLFDGSSEVNLYILGTYLLTQAKARLSHKEPDFDGTISIFNLKEAIPEFTGNELKIYNNDLDSILMGLHQINSNELQPLITQIFDEIETLDQQIFELDQREGVDPKSLQMFRLAEQYTWLFAAACTVQMWFYNVKSIAKPLQELKWLKLAIAIILNQVTGKNATIPSELYEQVALDMLNFYENKKLFSLLDVKIAD